MEEKITLENLERWHRYFAAECNNRAWDLASKSDRIPTEDQEMLNLAHASAYHWSALGKPVNNARADITLAHIHALLGHGQDAMKYALRALAFFESSPAEDWDLAFAHSELAFAAAVLGDEYLHAKHYALAKEQGEAIKEDENRQVFLDEFAKIPREVQPRL